MAKRFTDTDIWDKEWFMNLSTKHKCLIKFIFDKCDVAGIWDANWTLATTYVGEKCSLDDLEYLEGHLVKIRAGKFFVPDFIPFQYGMLSRTCNPHLKVISILEKHNLLEGYLKGISGEQDQDQDKEKEKDKDKEEDKGGVGESEKYLSLMGSAIWIESISTQKRLPIPEVVRYLEIFLRDLQLKGDFNKSERDIKRHFISWLNIKLKNGASKFTNDRAERVESAKKLGQSAKDLLAEIERRNSPPGN